MSLYDDIFTRTNRILAGQYVGRTGSSRGVGRELHGNVCEDEPQRETTLSGAAELGEIQKRESPSWR